MTALALTAADFTETDDDFDPEKALALPEEQRARVIKSRALANGLPAIRKGGKEFLPKLDGESEARYNVRVELGALHPAHDELLTGIVGTLCKTPITFEGDMPTEIVQLWENIDGRKTGGQKFTKTLLRKAMVDGMAGVFTDAASPDDTFDRTKVSAAAQFGGTLDAADGAALNIRPYCVQCRLGEFAATYDIINGQEVCVRFIRRETLTVRVGAFGKRPVTQYRVYRRVGNTVTREVWRKPLRGEGKATLVPNSLITLPNCDTICWAPLDLGDELTDGTPKPPLEALGDLVLQYYQIQNGMMSLSFEAFVATIVRLGAIPKVETLPDGTIKLTWPELLLGTGEVIEMPLQVDGVEMPDQPVYLLQPKSDVLVPASKMLETIQGLIDIITAALQGNDMAGESGEAKKQKARGGNARITGYAVALKEMWELVCQHLGMFVGKKAGGVNVKTTFEDITLSAQDVAAITGLVNAGMDVEEAVQVLIDRGFFGAHPDKKGIVERWKDNQTAKQDAAKIDASLTADQLNTPKPVT